MKTVYSILLFAIGFLTAYFLFRNDPSDVKLVSSTEPKAAVEMIHINNDKILSEISLRRKNNLLAGQLLIINKQLKDSRLSLSTERLKLKALQIKFLSDSTPGLDSLDQQQFIAQMDTINSVTDSLLCDYETKIQLTENMMAIRDSQLVVCNKAYQQMQSLAEEQLARERQLSNDLNTALKQQKRTRVQNKLLALGMLFVSGVTTSLIIKARQ